MVGREHRLDRPPVRGPGCRHPACSTSWASPPGVGCTVFGGTYWRLQALTAVAGGPRVFAPCKSWAPFCCSVYADAASLAVTKRSTGKSVWLCCQPRDRGRLPSPLGFVVPSEVRGWGGVDQVTLKAAVNSNVTVRPT